MIGKAIDNVSAVEWGRLLAKRRVSDTQCWLWTGQATPKGYGQVVWDRLGGKKRYVHRVAYAYAHGVTPAGMVVDHLCKTPRCFNPMHLRLVTRQQNVLENSVSGSALNKQKTTCPRCGGPYTLLARDNKRHCKPCRAKHMAAYHQRRKATASPSHPTAQ